MDENFPKRRRWVLIALFCLIAAVAIIQGLRNGRIGTAIRQIRELQAPAEERNRQIDELVNP